MIFYILLITAMYAIIRLSAFFSASETAFLAASKIKLKRLKREKRHGAKRALFLFSRLPLLLSLLLLAINFLSTLLSSLSTMLFMRLLSPFFLSFSGMMTSFVYTIFGNILPKTLSLRHPEEEALKSAKILYTLEVIFFPLIWLFSRFSFFVMTIIFKFIPRESSSLTGEELLNVFLLGEKEGSIKKNEREILSRILRLSEFRLYDIMERIPPSVCIPTNSTMQKITQSFTKTKSDFLLIKEKNKIIGVIDYRDALVMKEKKSPSRFAARIMKKPIFLPESAKILKVLDNFREMKSDFAVCLNEQGEEVGTISIDEVMKLVLGRKNIRNKREGKIFRKISGGELMVSASVKLVDLNEMLNLNLKARENTTLGGYLLERFDEIPEEGQSLAEAGYIFTVHKKNANKIELVHITLPSKG